MRTPVKLTAYALGLVLVFGAAAGAGRVLGPDNEPAPPPAHTDAHSDAQSDGHTDGHAGETAPAAGHLPGGLQVTQDGYRLTPVTTRLSTGAAQPFQFRVIGPDGKPVIAYTPNHEKDLHLIVVRRDLSGFQHVHPTLGADGTWSIPLAVDDPGQYRVFADFQPTGHDPLTLGVDVPAAGDYQPLPLPAPAIVAEAGDYLVTIGGDLAAGTSSQLTFTVAKDGQTVTDLEPYLGAFGHLVALRDGDLAYLHVHPIDAKSLAFAAEVPSSGVYRLYLDFKHDGKVHTAEFTVATLGVEAPKPTEQPGHDADGHTHN
ncbi:hypothetical protein [Actinoplanes sp. GCM10030250]|uniref:hypothetical protein n=1 Tax=Actinoplanes sp. GCM10030250 TaxID=3273376 RepID=UPI00360F5B6B